MQGSEEFAYKMIQFWINDYETIRKKRRTELSTKLFDENMMPLTAYFAGESAAWEAKYKDAQRNLSGMTEGRDMWRRRAIDVHGRANHLQGVNADLRQEVQLLHDGITLARDRLEQAANENEDHKTVARIMATGMTSVQRELKALKRKLQAGEEIDIEAIDSDVESEVSETETEELEADESMDLE